MTYKIVTYDVLFGESFETNPGWQIIKVLEFYPIAGANRVTALIGREDVRAAN